MIKLCVFDMGGVMIRDFHIAPELIPFLGYPKGYSFYDISPRLADGIASHSTGDITEEEFWKIYKKETGKDAPDIGQSLLGRFFHPVMDKKTVEVVQRIKDAGIRVVCGTNVIDAHYKIHKALGQYDIFDKVYPSHLMRIRKPNLDFYRYILDHENVSPEEAFFTDDLMENVEASIEAGMKGFLYVDAEKLEKDLVSIGVL